MNATLETPTLFALGDWVKFKLPPLMIAKVVELRGILGPNASQVYRLQIHPFRGKPRFIEVWEDQIEKTEAPRK